MQHRATTVTCSLPISPSPSPSKKQRISSFSANHVRPIPTTLPSAARLAQSRDFLQEREASAKRLLDVWSSLAERYTKRLDEDDIVDILTGRVVQDRGVVSSWSVSQQGSFCDPSARKEQEKERASNVDTKEKEESSNHVDNKGDVNGVDELDAFASTEDIEHVNLDTVGTANEITRDSGTTKRTSLTPDELKDFLEAERRRRALGGDDEDGDTSDVDLEFYKSRLRRFRSECLSTQSSPRKNKPREDDDGQSDWLSDFCEVDGRSPSLPPSSSPLPSNIDELDDFRSNSRPPTVPPSSSPPPFDDEESEDELGKWDYEDPPDEPALAAQPPQEKVDNETNDDDSEVEIISFRSSHTPATSRSVTSSPTRDMPMTKSSPIKYSSAKIGSETGADRQALRRKVQPKDEPPWSTLRRLKRKRVISSSDSDSSIEIFGPSPSPTPSRKAAISSAMVGTDQQRFSLKRDPSHKDCCTQYKLNNGQ
ncbi:hypothetical protein AMATHDRAFT_53561 [Amanita thiersii Skay4041]|uniref:Uncharacterized protein n=1 Tax=Amanita thiersii Skay4041 TaxID=703135 RepID=A0A2A9NSD3_9AGAR|nr:hypothetical protein AMATHDRAFT_53561 [Amanita thiersii Skay4041]